jgi:hypothetical protein
MISYERNQYGAWVLYASVNGYLVSRQYMGYTKAESTKLFRQYLKKDGN